MTDKKQKSRPLTEGYNPPPETPTPPPPPIPPSKNEKLISELGQTIKELNEKLHKKNLELDALYHIWCDGGCGGGVRRYPETREELPELTYELMEEAEAQVKRMRRWVTNNNWRKRQNELKDNARRVIDDEIRFFDNLIRIDPKERHNEILKRVKQLQKEKSDINMW
jgi:hypothetical protein